MRDCRASRIVGWGLSAILSLTVAIGCGGGGAGDNKATAPVTGKVTYNGAAVAGGEVVFSPIADPSSKTPPGQSGRAAVKSDGTYAVTTYKDGDGAAIGQHRISYIPAPPPPVTHDEKGNPVGGEQKMPAKLAPSKDTCQVVKGPNKIDIELVEAK